MAGVVTSMTGREDGWAPARHVRLVMAKVLEVDESDISDDSTPENLYQWDSLRHMAIVTALEQEFGLSFSTEEIWGLLSFEALCEAVREKASP